MHVLPRVIILVLYHSVFKAQFTKWLSCIVSLKEHNECLVITGNQFKKT